MLFRSKRNGAAAAEVQVDVSDNFGIRKLHFGGDDTQSAMKVADPLELVLAYTRCAFGFFCCWPRHRAMLC